MKKKTTPGLKGKGGERFSAKQKKLKLKKKAPEKTARSLKRFPTTKRETTMDQKKGRKRTFPFLFKKIRKKQEGVSCLKMKENKKEKENEKKNRSSTLEGREKHEWDQL